MSSIHKILTAASTANDNSSSRCSNNHSSIASAERIEWSRSTILGFIEDYRRQRVLWDPNTKGYHIKQTKYEALKALGNKYGTEVRSIRSKIKSLRSSFHREHGKVINGRRKGIHYQPMWFAYEAIRFILDSETVITTTNGQATTPTNAVLKSSPTAAPTAADSTAAAATALALASTFALQRQTLERSLAAAQALISDDNKNSDENDNGDDDKLETIPTVDFEKSAKDDQQSPEQKESNDVDDEDDDADYDGADGGEGDTSPAPNSDSNGNAAKHLLVDPYLMCAAEMGIQHDLLKAVRTAFNNNNNNSAQINHNNNTLTKYFSPKKSKSKTQPTTTTTRVSTPTDLSNGRNSSSSDQHAVGHAIGAVDVGAGAAAESQPHSSAAVANHTLNDHDNSPATYADAADHHHTTRLAAVHANAAAATAAAAASSGDCGTEANTAFRSDYDVDAQNFCNITAEDVKTEIIESDASEALERSISSTPTSLINYFKPKMRKRKANTATATMERYIEDAFAMPSKQLRLQTQHQPHQQQQHTKMQHQAQQQRELFAPPVAKHSTPTTSATTTSITNETTPQITQTKIPQQAQLEPSPQQQQTDEYGVFGEYVAITIRKLRTSKAKIVVKHLINNLLYEAELGKYDQGISSNRDPPELYKM